jgi:hypothetical protein
MLMRGVRGLRLVTRAVTAIQFAAVTFVPVVHPFLHHELVAAAPAASPLRPAPHDAPHDLLDGDECLICRAQPGMPQAVATGLGSCPESPVAPPHTPSVSDCRIAPRWPANSVRAPPQI